MDVKPKKHLGQHFLTDKNIANKIVDALELNDSKSLLEIGPGKGVLSKIVLDKGIKNFYVVDVDAELIQYLESNFPEMGNNIIHADFLKEDIFKQLEKPISILGNLPYNISSQIMFKILENRSCITEVVCMVQKEVADRYVSKPNTKVYGKLSVLLQAFYNIEYLFSVSNKVFNPQPKVKSAVIRLTRKDDYILNCPENLFFKVVKTGFGKRRKTLRNSLKTFNLERIKENEIFNKRPEQLNVNEFVHLTHIIHQNHENR